MRARVRACSDCATHRHRPVRVNTTTGLRRGRGVRWLRLLGPRLLALLRCAGALVLALLRRRSGSCTNSQSAGGTIQKVVRLCSDPIRAPEGILTGKLYVCSVCSGGCDSSVLALLRCAGALGPRPTALRRRSGSCTNSQSAGGTIQKVVRLCSDPIRAPEGILTGKLYVCSVCSGGCDSSVLALLRCAGALGPRPTALRRRSGSCTNSQSAGGPRDTRGMP